jgi:peptidoglycan/xylan/chitin deacetylase (PgdA/CDA1 family)
VGLPFLRWSRERNAQILIYHRVNEDHDPYFGGVPPAVFERQMAYVASRFRVLPLPELVAGLRTASLPEQAIAVTFDDGYRDNYLHAFPILRRYSIPATIFLATAAIGSNEALWHDDVFSAFRETRVPALESFGPRRTTGPLDTVRDRLRLQREVLTYVRTLDATERSAAIAELRDSLGVGAPSPAKGLMLSWNEVAEMHRAGVSFGSHTATHPILSLTNRDAARRELAESKRAIEERLGSRVDGFAYPNGARADFHAETKDLLRETGYDYAVTTLPGANEPGCDPFELRRETPWDEDVFAFGVRLHYNKLRS